MAFLARVAVRHRRAPQVAGDPGRCVRPAPPPATPSRRPPPAARRNASAASRSASTASSPRHPEPRVHAGHQQPVRRLPAQVRVLRRDVPPPVVEREQEPPRQLRRAPAARTARGPGPRPARTSMIRRSGRRSAACSTVDVPNGDHQRAARPWTPVAADRRRHARSPPAATPARCAPARASPTAATRRPPGAPASAADRDSPRSCRFPREVRCTRPSPSSSAQSATTRSAAAPITPPGSRIRASAPSAASCGAKTPGQASERQYGAGTAPL